MNSPANYGILAALALVVRILEYSNGVMLKHILGIRLSSYLPSRSAKDLFPSVAV